MNELAPKSDAAPPDRKRSVNGKRTDYCRIVDSVPKRVLNFEFAVSYSPSIYSAPSIDHLHRAWGCCWDVWAWDTSCRKTVTRAPERSSSTLGRVRAFMPPPRTQVSRQGPGVDHSLCGKTFRATRNM